jgi:Arabinose-binding domain of AraC transcription regulator, N-term
LRGEPRSRDSTETRNGYSYRTLRSGGLAALCSQSFGDALQRMARYKQIDLSGRDPDHPAPATRPPSSLTGCWRAIPVSAVLLELRFSWILSICRRGVGTPISPLRLKLACSGTHRELIEVHFDCRARFKADRNALVFRTSDLARPFVTYRAELLAMLGPPLEAESSARRSRQSLGE